MAHGIIILGANGSGKSTLGRELARVLNFTHFDVEDYYFYKTDVPYTAERSHEERNAMLLSDMQKYGSFVLSGDVSGWSKEFLPVFDLAILLKAPKDVRMKRIEEREYARWGDRVLEGGDMYESQQKFRKFAANRDVAELEQRVSAYPCPIIEIDSTEDNHEVAASIAERFYSKPDEPWRVTTYPLGELKTYRFTVIFAQYGKVGGGWLYARHKNRNTWETAGGHIEKGETPLDCAKRELREETGAEKFCIHPAFDYAVHTSTEFSFGQVFFADVETLGELPPEYEMREVKAFPTIPDAMTYPQILPVIFAELQKWLGMANTADEYWDIYDKNRKPTGRIHRRGDPLPDGDYHLVAHVWVVRSDGRILITKRAPNKPTNANLWESTHGAVLMGEDTLTAAIREVKEETGLDISNSQIECIGGKPPSAEYAQFVDWFLVRHDFDLADVKLQNGETVDVKAVTVSEIDEMMDSGEFGKYRSWVRVKECLNKLKLVKPSIEYSEQISSYLQEFRDSGELPSGKAMHGGQGMEQYDNPADWIEYCRLLENPETVPVEGWADASQYFAIREFDGKLIGLLNMRHRLTPRLEMDGGHIGYSVRPSERRKGYATEILRLGLDECRNYGFDRVLATCKAINEASKRTIIANGGILERTVFYDGAERKHYRITL